MKKKLVLAVTAMLIWCLSGVAAASGGIVELTPGAERAVNTAKIGGLPAMFGGAEYFYSVIRLGRLAAGQRYEVTLTFESGTDIGYAHTWVDGNPFGSDFAHFVGIGSGTGTGPKRESQQKFLFTVDPKSSSGDLYLVFRSHRPMPLRVALQRPSGVTKNSQDRWGYYYVTDFDADRTAPFLLKR